MLIKTSKGTFHAIFTHHRNAAKNETTRRSISRFHKEVPSQTKREILGTTECVLATVPNTDLVTRPRKSRPVLGITGRSKGDRFSASIGCRLALTRALKAAAEINPLFEDKAFRREVWNAYLATTKTKTAV